MPIEHWVQDEPRLLRVRRWGPVTTHDEDEASRRRREDPAVRPGVPVLVDCREVDPPDDSETVRYLADRVPRIAAHLRCGPVALVVATDVEYGMARMYMSYTEPAHPDIAVFRDPDQAVVWLLKSRQADAAPE